METVEHMKKKGNFDLKELSKLGINIDAGDSLKDNTSQQNSSVARKNVISSTV